MKKICFITAARSEYGLLKWLMREIDKTDGLTLQLIVTGAHLSAEQGHTIDIIIEDGLHIDQTVDVQWKTSSKAEIADTMGRLAQALPCAFTSLSPDYVVVLGDRYELLPIVNTAFIMSIPIIHISGGDVTEGAIDDGIRNAVTMLADYHFPGTTESAQNIARMRGNDINIWTVGEPGLDAFYKESMMSREELAKNLNLDVDQNWALFTFHAETKESLEYNLHTVKSSIELLLSINDLQVVATYSNADYGGDRINAYLESVSSENADKLMVIPSLGSQRYLSFMRQVRFVIGNSSSGIVEAPTLGIPVINIGNRQKGRHLCSNVIQTSADSESIRKSISRALSDLERKQDFYWGNGHTAEAIVEILKKELL